jgi:hypothetical protein
MKRRLGYLDVATMNTNWRPDLRWTIKKYVHTDPSANFGNQDTTPATGRIPTSTLKIFGKNTNLRGTIR